MHTTLLDSIPFEATVEDVACTLRLDPAGEYMNSLADLLESARAVAHPKGLYKIAFVDSRGDDSVVIDGIRFTSRILRVNLDEAERVFPFVATCGVELDEWSNSITDMFLRYCADGIKEMALEAAVKALGDHLVATYRPGATAMMNPGSLEDWPTAEQRNLFRLLGDVVGAIGVRLSESFVMSPIKSISGLWFPTETGFQSCQLCPRERCPKRRAPYDPALYEAKYKG